MSTAFTLAQALLNCACTGLAGQDPPWEGTCCVSLWPADYDNCCETGGHAWARVVRMYPSTVFPGEDSGADPGKCATAWAVVIEVGVVRCVCFDLCDCEVKSQNSVLVLDDAEALLNSVVCCFERGACNGQDYRVLGQEMIAPSGGCAGSKVTVVVRSTSCCTQ